MGENGIKLADEILLIAVGELRLAGGGEMTHAATTITASLAAEIGYEIIPIAPHVSAFYESSELLLNEVHALIQIAC